MGDTNRNDEALGAIGTAFGEMLFAGSELAQLVAIERQADGSVTWTPDAKAVVDRELRRAKKAARAKKPARSSK